MIIELGVARIRFGAVAPARKTTRSLIASLFSLIGNAATGLLWISIDSTSCLEPSTSNSPEGKSAPVGGATLVRMCNSFDSGSMASKLSSGRLDSRALISWVALGHEATETTLSFRDASEAGVFRSRAAILSDEVNKWTDPLSDKSAISGWRLPLKSPTATERIANGKDRTSTTAGATFARVCSLSDNFRSRPCTMSRSFPAATAKSGF